jgi:hypothetical protein
MYIHDGDEGAFVGFAGTCSKDNIERNVRNNRVWCSSQLCECRNFYDSGLNGTKPVGPCYESQLFQDWEFGAGGFHTDIKTGAIHLTQAQKGKFAILTTRFPGDPESERRSIGLFRIAKIEEHNLLTGARKGRIRLPLEEAKELFFWAYCTNTAKKPDWRTGLFRYLDDGQVHRILEDLALTVRDENTKSELNHLISQAFGGGPAPPASGCLPEKSTNRAAALAKLRKYGPGGEGKAHKELKEWISKHPEALNLTDIVSVTVERTFISGDAADVVFTHKSGSHTVVEIETTTPLPGAHQAIKYRALLCAENGLPLDTNKVKAILVAWSVPSKVQNFCKNHGVGFQEYRLRATN